MCAGRSTEGPVPAAARAGRSPGQPHRASRQLLAHRRPAGSGARTSLVARRVNAGHCDVRLAAEAAGLLIFLQAHRHGQSPVTQLRDASSRSNDVPGILVVVVVLPGKCPGRPQALQGAGANIASAGRFTQLQHWSKHNRGHAGCMSPGLLNEQTCSLSDVAKL